MAKLQDLRGCVFERLTAVERRRFLHGKQGQKRRIAWLCRCSCGGEVIVATSSLLSGRTRSCGCLRQEYITRRNLQHGEARKGSVSKTYHAWLNMKTRCYNARAYGYQFNGGKGIRVCKRWLFSFDAFVADMGESPPGAFLIRRNTARNYTPKNCFWGKRKHQGATSLLSQRAETAAV